MAKTKRKPAAKAKRASKTTARRATPARRTQTKAAKKKAKPPRKQRFVVSHHREEDFEGGLRRYAKYRDLGIAQATNGMVQAHVIRFVPPCRPEEVSKRHYHDVDFQMVYVLKGWFRSEFEGEGVHTFAAGSCWIQPPKIKHTVRGYSDDCELLEIVLPAEFETVTLEE